MHRDRLIGVLTWMARIGYALAALGLALMSPLVDFLPMEALPFLRGDFTRSGGNHYYRVVTISRSAFHVVPLVIAVVGVVLVVTASVLRRWRGGR